MRSLALSDGHEQPAPTDDIEEEFDFEIVDHRDELRAPATASASDVLPTSALQPGDQVWLWCRVSSWEQHRDRGGSHLDDMMIALYRAAKERGANVVGVSRVVWPGSDILALEVAANRARKLGAALLTESASRFLRTSTFDPTNKDFWDAQPRLDEWKYFDRIVGDVRRFTVIDPDASAADERAHQSRRGVQMKSERPTRRGPLAWRRRVAEPLVRELNQYGGHGPSEIERMTGISRSTVSDWMRRNSEMGQTVVTDCK